jgi:hypothetical protein
MTISRLWFTFVPRGDSVALGRLMFRTGRRPSVLKPMAVRARTGYMRCVEHMRLRLLCGLAPLAACGVHGTSNSNAALAVSCSWPASFDPADSAIGECVAARVYISCEGSNGVVRECISNDPAQCPGPNPFAGVSFSHCTNKCNPDEYALACGAPGPGPWPQPPAACRGLPSGPGGGSFSCCPCGG